VPVYLSGGPVGLCVLPAQRVPCASAVALAKLFQQCMKFVGLMSVAAHATNC